MNEVGDSIIVVALIGVSRPKNQSGGVPRDTGLGNGPPTDCQSVEKGSAMTVNWWSVWGLISDIIGVLGVGIIPPDVWANTVIPNVWVRRYPLREGIVLNPRWQRPMHWSSWGMILLGFLLQLMGQFRR